MFVKKLVEKASKKSGISSGLKPEDLDPHLAFHHGLPTRPTALAYDPVQKILAISTRDGLIKLYGRDNTQAILQSNEAVPSKFLQFIENQGILVNVNGHNQIEVWDIDGKRLSHVHLFKKEITSFTIMQQSFFIYVGDSHGSISVLKLEREPCNLIHMQYNIPFSASRGATVESAENAAVLYALPQPMAESRRILIIFRDDVISLWGIQESKVMLLTGGNTHGSPRHEKKEVISACWACPYGSKVVVGYSNGDIFLWSVPRFSNVKVNETCLTQNIPLFKLNLGYKMDKVPVVFLKWVVGDGKTSRLYINGMTESGSSHSFQVIILNETTESRIIKLLLPLSEACQDMEIISINSDRNKHKQDVLLLLLKSGRVCMFDDSEIEKYLLKCHSKSAPTLPKQVFVRLPYGESNISVAKLVTDNSDSSAFMDEDLAHPAKNFPSLFATDAKDRSAARFSGNKRTKNLYITGHSNGDINFWDASCPFLLLILSIKQQSEGNHGLRGVPVTALHFDVSSQLLISGDQSGMVRIFKFKPDADNKFFSLQVNGAIVSISIDPSSRHLAVGSDRGYVSIINMEGPALISQKHIASESNTGVMQIEFSTLNGSGKSVLLVGMEDSSVFALEGDTGNMLSNSMVHPKKPSRALFMQIFDGPDASVKGDVIKENVLKGSLLLVCSAKAVRLYSLSHVIQGIKKAYNKKKLHGVCCWASTFYSPCLDPGLILVFTNGKVEIRSIPDLTLTKETSLRGFAYTTSRSTSNTDYTLCSSHEGELVVVNGDQEIFFFSVLTRNNTYRFLETIGQIYDKIIIAPYQGSSSVPVHKKRKRYSLIEYGGILGMVIKEITGSKSNHDQETEHKDSGVTSEQELSTIFSTTNFSFAAETRDEVTTDEEGVELNIDDIEIEDHREEPKKPVISSFKKKNLNSAFQGIKGKLKTKKVNKSSNSAAEVVHEEKGVGAVDQIKKRYGYPVTGESSAARMAVSKLNENLRKLQGISLRTTEMEDQAKSFSANAKLLLKTVEEKRMS
ncbi:hypothetical protein QJS10_CPB11g02158 [Acorus calamus]|uniref:Lethal giant larvae (Lgl)-like C-terminal domain-containing protein n=1 Tax=Acorus calamus TaxID=4465 RepID=A0AAV9DXP0_ACOCL|nr:hypothetical protein QJS10_CPB11g02158 [Acorus calamus]